MRASIIPLLFARQLMLVFAIGFACVTPADTRGQDRYGAEKTADGARDAELRGTVRDARRDAGYPFFSEHFTPREYRAKPQNWAVVQDTRGVIYVGNNDGVLEYDGARWRLIRTLTNTVIRSLGVDEAGSVYVGAQGDIGYLAPDSTGSMSYYSLLDNLAPDDRDFGDVWGVQTSKGGVYFQARDRLIRWDGRAMTVIRTNNLFHNTFKVRDRLFVREHGRGLMEIAGDSLLLVPDGEAFEAIPIFVMAPHGREGVLIGTRDRGFFLHDGKRLTSFETEVDDFVAQNKLYYGCSIGDGNVALATLGGGVAVIDTNGRLLRVLNEENGFPDNWVNHLYVDVQGGVWMALNNKGVFRADVMSPLTYYDEEMGIDGVINSVAIHNRGVYVATSAGLYMMKFPEYSQDDYGSLTGFVKMDIDEVVNHLVSFRDVLLAATNRGVYEIVSVYAHKIDMRFNGASFSLLESSTHDAIVYVGAQDGLYLMAREREDWSIIAYNKSIRFPVHSMAESGNDVWLTGREGGVYRFSFSHGHRSEPAVRQFLPSDGLPDGVYTVTVIDGKVVVASQTGIYAYHESAADSRDGWFEPDLRFQQLISDRDSLFYFTVDSHDQVWAIRPDRIEIGRRSPDGAYHFESPPVLRLPYLNPVHLYLEENGVAWIGNNSSQGYGPYLLRYDPSVKKAYDQPFATLVRRVAAVGSEQAIYGGALPAGGNVASPGGKGERVPSLSYAQNDVVIDYAAPSFNLTSQNQFQYRLEGYSRGWSAWTQKTSQTFMNLREGTYRFHVRARNGQGIRSPVATFDFRILPPWYRTWWAYLFYLGMLFIVVAAIQKYRRIMHENRLAREHARELARERTLNHRLQMLNESLVQADQLKDELLANTSHELRTPITAILGFTSLLKDEVVPEHREFLEIIESSSHRLLNTVNALLDFAKLQAGAVEVEFESLDIRSHTEDIVRVLYPLAQGKGLAFDFIQPDDPCTARIDRRYYERILYNLIGNAIKFTDVGKVSVEVGCSTSQVYVSVKDTGIGINADFLPHLFEAFKQESTGLTRLHQGSGLGLAITARLIKLMHGQITVDSKKGQGSVFTVYLPCEVGRGSELDSVGCEEARASAFGVEVAS